VSGARRRGVFDFETHFGALIEAMSLARQLVLHERLGDDRVDLDGGDVAAAGRQSARDVVAAARADDQRFRRGTNRVGEAGTATGQLAAIVIVR